MNIQHTGAITRKVPNNFSSAICKNKPIQPIDINLARKQHESYVGVLKELLDQVIELETDERFPDCMYVEDNVVIIGERCLITNMGADSRQGEEKQIKELITNQLREKISHVNTMQAPASLEGGDVLFVPNTRDILVGVSSRTNNLGVQSLQRTFDSYRVIPIPLSDDSLHLKSVLTWIPSNNNNSNNNYETLIVYDSDAGRKTFQKIQESDTNGIYNARYVPDLEAANIVCIRSQKTRNRWTVLHQSCETSESILQSLANEFDFNLRKIEPMTESAKADGALTCCSVLF